MDSKPVLQSGGRGWEDMNLLFNCFEGSNKETNG